VVGIDTGRAWDGEDYRVAPYANSRSHRLV